MMTIQQLTSFSRGRACNALLCLASLALVHVGSAREVTATVSESLIFMDLPADWHHDPASFLQGAMFRPVRVADGYPSLTVALAFKDPEQEFKLNKKSVFESLLSSRQEWLATEGGQWLRSDPAAVLQGTRPGVQVQRIGFRYRLGGNVFEERNYLIRCRHQVFIAGGLSSAAQLRAGTLTIFEKAIRSFTCFI